MALNGFVACGDGDGWCRALFHSSLVGLRLARGREEVNSAETPAFGTSPLPPTLPRDYSTYQNVRLLLNWQCDDVNSLMPLTVEGGGLWNAFDSPTSILCAVR